MIKNKNFLISSETKYVSSHIIDQLVKAASNIIIFFNLVAGY